VSAPLVLPPEAMAATRREVRADLVACFERNLDAELQAVNASWWANETQNTLHALSAKLGKKSAATSKP
jgi:hypothetical protein